MNDRYSDELSCSSSENSFNFDEEEKVSRSETPHKTPTPTPTDLITKCIIHLDIDCFYCQCEEILNPTLATKPLAIGQKHIVVTANYVARRLGIKKLMGREEAKKVCPSLTIVEGSNLEKYRKASREVYVEFRNSVKELGEENAAKKGCMDEMFADVTCAVRKRLLDESNNKVQVDIYFDRYREHCSKSQKSGTRDLPPKTFIYGEDEQSSTVKISEDQSGAEAIIKATSTVSFQNKNEWGTDTERRQCVERLKIAITIASQIRERIRSKTQFSTTVGVSVSPMLAKLACDLKKPDANNLFYPWRAKTVIHNMPLRRIPDLGSRTLKALANLLRTIKGDSSNLEYWTCSDLLRVPRDAIIDVLSNHDSFQKNCEKQCDLILQRCNGIDYMPIIDDGGELSKTVSVEDSFIRGSILSFDIVVEKLQSLYGRLLRLLVQRKDFAAKPALAYPRALRVSVRIVDRSLEKIGRRPFRTISKQTTFNGKRLMGEPNQCVQESLLKETALPLLTSLLKDGTILELNVTRLNLAVVAFADIDDTTSAKATKLDDSTNQRSLSSYFSHRNLKQTSNITKATMKSPSPNKRSLESPSPSSSSAIKQSFERKKKLKPNSPQSVSKEMKPPPGIDPTVFASLPSDIANEVLKNPSMQQTNFVKKKKNKGITSFFKKR